MLDVVPRRYPGATHLVKTAFKFTQAAIDKIRPPESGRVDYSNTAIPGMQLRVSASGRRVYRVKTRVNGVQVPSTIGSTAIFTLAEASKTAREFLRQAAEGINPIEAKRSKLAIDSNIVRVVFDRYLRQRVVKRSAEYYKEVKRAIERDMLPDIGRTPIDKLTRRQIRDVIDKIAERSEPHAAHVRRYFNAFLNWAVEQDFIAVNPGVGPDPDTRRREDRERDRWLRDDEIRLFWYACNRVGHSFSAPFKLLLLLGCRRDEMFGAPWGEFDLDRQLWTLPATRAPKNGSDHLVHLAAPVLTILNSLPRLRPWDPSELLFSATGVTPLSGFDAALDRVRAEMADLSGQPTERFVLHDLRRSFAGGMAMIGVAESIVDRCLAHTSRKVSGTARIYNRFQYLPARKMALETWANHVMELIQPKAVETASAE
jgi:integrase